MNSNDSIIDKDYIKNNLISYLGNKRRLIHHINDTIIELKLKLNRNENIKIFDGFSGSGVISKLLKYHCNDLYINDIEKYSYIINDCYLSNPTPKEIKKINKYIDECNYLDYDHSGIILNEYCPKDENNIKKDDRVFYTRENGYIIDTIRNKINSYPKKYHKYLIASLLVKSSIHVNTSGVFRGFHKNKHTKIGCYGGTEQNDLKRIKGKNQIRLSYFFRSNTSM